MSALRYLQWLETVVRAKLRENPIGEPVSLRAYLQLGEDHGLLLPATAAALGLAESWLGSPTRTVYAQGGSAAGYINILASFHNGRTALLCLELLNGQSPDVLLLLVGNHGTMEYRDRPGEDGLTVDLSPPESGRHRALAMHIERSLADEAPVRLNPPL
jgi:hypothetical protein